MGPDWFTVIAQIINFLILVALLKRFLYAPIINAMDRREKEIAESLDDAARKARAAGEEGARYQAMARELADTREKMLAEARQEADVLRKELKQKAREETERSQAQWHEAFNRQQEAFAQGLRLQACSHVFAVIRRVLSDLADANLEERIIDVFIRRIRNMNSALQQEITHSIISSGREIIIRSAFAINPEGQRKIVAVIREQIDTGDQPAVGDFSQLAMNISFETSASLICGIELVADGRKVTWGIEGYLDELGENFTRACESGRAGSTAKITLE